MIEKLKRLTEGKGFRSGRVEKEKEKGYICIRRECFSRFLDS